MAHGATLVVSLFQPLLPVTDQSLAVEIDGFRQKEFVELPSPYREWVSVHLLGARGRLWPCWQVGVSPRI